jgi:predicted nucleic-acid-binding protein
MIGLDTNILVRYLTHDDPTQTAAAIKVMSSLSSDSPGFLSLVVIAELVWVLTVAYDYPRKEIAQVMEALLRSKELVTEQAEIVSQALRMFGTGHAEFADCLIERCANAAECQYTLTFDRKAAKSTGMRLLR